MSKLLLGLGLGLFILIIIIIIIYTNKKNQQNDSQNIARIKIQNSMLSSGVKILKKPESFENSEKDSINPIIFNSPKIIKDNFENYLKTYFTLLDIEKINNKLKELKGKTIQEIINSSNINAENIVYLSKTIPEYKLYCGLILGLEDKLPFLCNCFNILLMRKLLDSDKTQICDYYLSEGTNDYTDKDIIIYSGKCDTDEKILANINELSNETSGIEINLDNTKLIKISMTQQYLYQLLDYLDIIRIVINDSILNTYDDYTKLIGYTNPILNNNTATNPLDNITTTTNPLNNVTTTTSSLNNVTTTTNPLNNVTTTTSSLNNVTTTTSSLDNVTTTTSSYSMLNQEYFNSTENPNSLSELGITTNNLEILNKIVKILANNKETIVENFEISLINYFSNL